MKAKYFKSFIAIALTALIFTLSIASVSALDNGSDTPSIEVVFGSDAEGIELELFEVADYTNGEYILNTAFAASNINFEELTDSTAAQDAAEALKDYVYAQKLSGTVVSISPDYTVKFDNLDANKLYLIVPTINIKYSIQSLLVTVPYFDGSEYSYNVTVDAKYQIIPEPSVTKEVSGDGGQTFGSSANINAMAGDKAVWKITAEIPTNINLYKIYTVGDILDNRLIPPEADEVTVELEGSPIPQDFYTVDVTGQTISVTFNPKKLVPYAGGFVDIFFPTAIDLEAENSIGFQIENIATLTYTKIKDESERHDTDTDTSTDTGTTTDTDVTTDTETTTTITTTVVEVWTGEIAGFKHDKDKKALSGAEFTLYSDKDCKNVIATSVSDKDGNFGFKGLEDGTYYLKETKAPEGYQADDKVYEIELNKDKTYVEIDVLNITKPNLPQTGGAGIVRLTLFGILVAAVGALLIAIAIRTRKHTLRNQPSMS